MLERMKLSDALRFSRKRQASHSTLHPENGIPASIVASDFGVENITLNGYGGFDTQSEAWSEMPSEMRRLLLKSEDWEPVDQKPVMLILAEAACDWHVHEIDDDTEHPPLEEEDYSA